MKLCGHTLGVPDKNIFEAIDFFSTLGHEGIEVRCASTDNPPVGQINPEEFDNLVAEKILSKLQKKKYGNCLFESILLGLYLPR